MDLPPDPQAVQATSVLHKKILAAVARAQQVYFIDKVSGWWARGVLRGGLLLPSGRDSGRATTSAL